MFCSNCGEKMASDTKFCSNCGASANSIVVNNTTTVTQESDDSGGGWGVLGFFFPFIGLILFCVWQSTKPKSAKAAGIGALIATCLSVFFLIIAIIIAVISESYYYY